MSRKATPDPLEAIDRYHDLRDACGALYAACGSSSAHAAGTAWLAGQVLEMVEDLNADLEALLQPSA